MLVLNTNTLNKQPTSVIIRNIKYNIVRFRIIISQMKFNIVKSYKLKKNKIKIKH